MYNVQAHATAFKQRLEHHAVLKGHLSRQKLPSKVVVAPHLLQQHFLHSWPKSRSLHTFLPMQIQQRKSRKARDDQCREQQRAYIRLFAEISLGLLMVYRGVSGSQVTALMSACLSKLVCPTLEIHSVGQWCGRESRWL